MNRLIESDSFETRISNMLEDGFTDTGWDSHVFYELDDLIIEDSEENYRSLASQLTVKNTYQLYRDYLDNFKINIERK